MGGSGFLNFKILEALLCCIMADFKFVLSNSVVPDSSEPMGCDPPGSSVHWILQEEYWGDFPFPVPGDLLNPGI